MTPKMAASSTMARVRAASHLDRQALIVLACLLSTACVQQVAATKQDVPPAHYSEPKSPSQFTSLTLRSGAIVGDKFDSLTLGPRGPILLSDIPLIEELAHFARERIPERVVHAKGAAAFGIFKVTNTSIARFCKAPLFAALDKQTPVAVRFSHVAGESGFADTPRDVRGFAVKFYTDIGNWDLVGNNLPVFFVRDPINFASFIHTQKRNPRTHLKDPDAFWEFVAQRPEAVHTMMMLFSDRGVPDGFRHMHGFGVDTFKLVNDKGQQFYAKFHYLTNQGIKNLLEESSIKVAGIDPDYYLRDLQLAISKGDFPSWKLKFQVMSLDEAEKADFDVLDVTKTWPHARFPLMDIGEFTLTTNPTNYFAQVEQLAFSPANMVSGIEPSPDKMLTARLFSYPDAQRYRLGVNYFDIPVNQPRCPFMSPTYVDGVTTRRDFGNGTVPNYVPSDKFINMLTRDKEHVERPQYFAGNVGRYDLSDQDNYSQARILYRKVLNEDERKRLAKNIAGHMRRVSDSTIVDKVLSHWREVDENLANDIQKGIKALAATMK